MRSNTIGPPDGDSRRPFDCISLDLEIGVQDRRIHKFAGVRPVTGQSLIFPAAGARLDAALTKLDDLADSAEFLLGHNLIEFDLPHLQAANPRLRLLRLPAVDTLRLNPLAFPRNPYHHLVKHYQDGQLIRDRKNDPELDARLTLEVFDNQQCALRAMPSDMLTAWHWLTTRENGAGFDRFFASVRQSHKPSDTEAYDALHSRFAGNACRTHARKLMKDTARRGWALAYALAWMSVAGGNSVMPPWVRHQFPDAGRLVRRLRDTACADPACDWCRERHDARKELKRWFGFPDFRPEPADEVGRPIQQSVVEAAMAGENLLAILPTGTGKSVCYQVPALSRYDKTGALTVVISPLVALMSDQVTGLEKRGIGSCVTVNGLLSMPERADALDRVRLGDASILLIAPEQLRSVSLRRVLAQREIGAWVLDEAHCLSKWGHDFRPDYRYVGRFIREKAGEEPVPQVLCLTATAKPDVKAEILEYFQDELGIELRIFDGGAQRTNLEFVVVKTSSAEKHAHVYKILMTDLPEHEKGGAIVYCATRRQTKRLAEFLQEKGIKADYFHAGRPSETKKTVQESFIEGGLRVIAATNAFGMGIDKENVRLVIHASIPGSLENYLQEAGRAGRDREKARCVLLYTQEDVERQFDISARSRLTRREIHGVLRALRKLDRKEGEDAEVIATAGEILKEDEERDFERDSATDDTRVRTAVAWLEEAVLLTREENEVKVFPSSLRVSSKKEAHAKLEKARFPDGYTHHLLAICEKLIEADPDEGITTDDLMVASGLTPKGVQRALNKLEELGIASNDTPLTAFVHAGVERASKNRFSLAVALERALIHLLQEMAPDMSKGDTHPLNLRLATQRLRDDGLAHALPERVQRIIRSIAADGEGEEGEVGSLKVRVRNQEIIHVTLQREWGPLEKTAELRRAAAGRLLDYLLSCLPRGARGTDLLAETTMNKLLWAVQSDLTLMNKVTHPDKLMDRALLWLHEQEVIRLNKGLTVFRPAMTIRLKKEKRDFTETNFQPLRFYYDEQVLQIHVMMEYAQQGLESFSDAVRLSMDYFSLPKKEFLQRWLPGREKELSRQTTSESLRAIVESLKNPMQDRIVADDREQTNVLVLAGPGSGKTRVLVHRIAYLIRVRRENPRGILALAYNRHAAVEIRRRLSDLIGDNAHGVIVLTYHALAMRLVGASFWEKANRPNDSDFRTILLQATSLLRGEGLPPEEADEMRTRLLAGFRWILVDEYQDIDSEEYALISALAGRTISQVDDKLNLFAVGDDDQNIYTFKGSSVEFIRRFEEDYSAKPFFLTDNYRSTAHIIEAANAVIEHARKRMKTENPIHVDRARGKDPHGGVWTELDPVTKGRVQILPVGDTPITQAQGGIAELQRLSDLSPAWNWSTCAVVAREWSYLDPVRTLCELEGIPVQMANEDSLAVWHLRETQALVNWLRGRESRLVQSVDLSDWLGGQRASPWTELLEEAISAYELETGGAETAVDQFIEWLAEWGRDLRRRQRGLLLLTAHRAKGLEFDHVVVLDGGWASVSRGKDADAQRRLYYVAMSRARDTLTLARFPGAHPFQNSLRNNPAVLHRPAPVKLPPAPPELVRQYKQLSLRDVFLSFAGYRHANDPVHRAIAALSPGDPLQLRVGTKGRELLDRKGMVVGQLASGFVPPLGTRCISASVMAIATWNREFSEPQYQSRLRCDTWEVVVPELVFEPDS